jgi:hypothetical protein
MRCPLRATPARTARLRPRCRRQEQRGGKVGKVALLSGHAFDERMHADLPARTGRRDRATIRHPCVAQDRERVDRAAVQPKRARGMRGVLSDGLKRDERGAPSGATIRVQVIRGRERRHFSIVRPAATATGEFRSKARREALAPERPDPLAPHPSARPRIFCGMSEPRIVLVDHDVRTRPRMPWREAWATSRGHDLSTISAWSYARETVTHGGWLAVVPPVVVSLILAALFLAVGFGAAVLAASAHGSTTRAALILLASVVLSQVLSVAQNRQLGRRLFIVANVRVSDTPSGWAIAFVRVPTRTAPRAKSALLGAAFRHVETTYLHDASEAELAAYYRIKRTQEPANASNHAEVLLADAPGAMPYVLTTVLLSP